MHVCMTSYVSLCSTMYVHMYMQVCIYVCMYVFIQPSMSSINGNDV